MTYQDAIKKLKVGVPVGPCGYDIHHNKLIGKYGNYLITDVSWDIENKIIYAQIDNGQIFSHKNLTQPCICGSKFYCSWYGMTTNILKTGLSDDVIHILGIMTEKEARDRGYCV